MNNNIGVVIVTYNRLDKLRITLDKFDNQSLLPSYIAVVNNASTDGTEDFLISWKKENRNYKKIVLNLDSNYGGSGGFYNGLKYAAKLNASWVWVSDDDAFPETDALKNANDFLMKHKEENISAISGVVINKDRIDKWHRRNVVGRLCFIKDVFAEDEDYNKEYFEINSFSYVGTIINVSKLEEVGYTNKDYFIYEDDSEHSLRLSKVGKIYCVPSIRIHHDVEDDKRITWKTYYTIRNKADLIRKHFPKRYYYVLICKSYIKAVLCILFTSNKILGQIIFDAYKDLFANKFGVSDKYYPGWKPNN